MPLSATTLPVLREISSVSPESTSSRTSVAPQSNEEGRPFSPLPSADSLGRVPSNPFRSAPSATDALAASLAPENPLVEPMESPTKHRVFKVDKKVWTTTCWPFCARHKSNTPQETGGDTATNLWAKNGCLDKFDQLLEKRGMPTGARAHELVPALNFLKNDGSPSGYYIPAKFKIRERDAERTTGVDFSGDGKLKAGVHVDFLDDNSLFGQNGQTNGSLDVSWWGSCDKVALAGLLFEDPKSPVTLDGITFTTQDIRGLLTVIAGSQASQFEYAGTRFSGRPDRVVLKDGAVHLGRAINVTTEDCLRSDFERVNGNQLRVKRLVNEDEYVDFETGSWDYCEFDLEDLALLEREDRAEPSASDFHQTVKRWLREGRPFAMDRDSGKEVWNVSVDEAEIWKSRQEPFHPMQEDTVGFNGPMGDGDLCFYKTTLNSNAFASETYYYWIEKRDGEDVNSGWTKNNPAFLWRPTVSEPSFAGYNQRNPLVDPALVKEIYLQSIVSSSSLPE